jgi:hypothetical protein
LSRDVTEWGECVADLAATGYTIAAWMTLSIGVS